MDTNALADDLIQAWNSHDLDRILSHYSDAFELSSPIVRRVRGIADGRLEGKPAVRQWWQQVLDKVPDLGIELVGVSEGVRSTAVIQRISGQPGLGISIFRFDERGLIGSEEFHAG